MGFEVGTLEAFGLYLIRVSALVLLSPLVGERLGFAGYKIALILGLACVLYLSTGAPTLMAPSTVAYGALAAREALIGSFMALLGRLAMSSAYLAGHILGFEMGLQMANQVDPTSGESKSILALFYEQTFLIALLSVDGHHWIVKSLAATFEIAPVTVLGGGGTLGVVVVDVLSQTFVAGVAFIAPLSVLMTLVSVAIGLLARTVPQINVLEMSFSMRVGAALVGMTVLAPLFAPAMGRLLEVFDQALQTGLQALAAGGFGG